MRSEGASAPIRAQTVSETDLSEAFVAVGRPPRKTINGELLVKERMKAVLRFDEISKLENPYAAADKANALLKKKAARRLSKCRGELMLLLWLADEVLKRVKKLYRDIDEDAKKALMDVAKESYRQYAEGGNEPDSKWLNSEILKTPCPVTGYTYENEAERKTERAIEAILSVKKNAEKSEALIRFARYRQTQNEYYTDYVADMAMRKACEDAGVEKVKWVAAHDEKTCRDCMALNGKIFALKDVPDKPHPRCRCTLIPVKEK